MDSAITRSKTPKALLALKVRNILPQILKEVLPKGAHKEIKNIKATTLKEKTLTVFAPSSAFSAQLKLSEGKIVGQINSNLRAKIVERVRFRVKV